jgi:hypothetical protein
MKCLDAIHGHGLSILQHCSLHERGYIQGKSALVFMANQARFLARVEVILEDLFNLAKRGPSEIETLQIQLLEDAGVEGLLEPVAQYVPEKIMVSSSYTSASLLFLLPALTLL